MSSITAYLKTLNASIDSRNEGAAYINKKPNLLPELFELATQKRAHREHLTAAWVLEVYILKDLSQFDPYWIKLLKRLPEIKHESMRRPLSKILYTYLQKNFKDINSKQKDAILSICFDWLLEPAAVATQNYALRCLYRLRNHQDWVQEELVAIVREQYPHATPGYRAAARQILNL